MQTFLPYADFQKSAECLDRARLGKQRSEAKVILNILLKKTNSKAWTNHPATKMWEGYEQALIRYAIAVCKEWRRRGYKDSLLPFFQQLKKAKVKLPHWLGSKAFHDSHKSNLKRKLPNYYKFKVLPTLPYYWPN